jgi:uncharacterized protein
MTTAAPARVQSDPILADIKRRLSATYGERLARIVLFGSRARGDFRRDSDYDVAVYLDGYDYTMGEIFNLADISWDIQVDTGAIVSFKPFASGHEIRGSVLSHEIARDGVRL